jgi:hypothetical protein
VARGEGAPAAGLGPACERVKELALNPKTEFCIGAVRGSRRGFGAPHREVIIDGFEKSLIRGLYAF